MSKEEIKQVIVVRKDLKMRKGKIAAQVAHASLGVVLQQIQIDKNGAVDGKLNSDFVEWICNGPFTKIVVGCEDEASLLTLKVKADGARLPTCLIMDAGKTEFHGIPTRTCLAIGPAKSSAIDKLTGELSLL